MRRHARSAGPCIGKRGKRSGRQWRRAGSIQSWVDHFFPESLRMGLLWLRHALRRYQRTRARHLRQWIFAQWRGRDSAGRSRMAVSALLVLVAVATDADAQQPVGHGFGERVRNPGELAAAAPRPDAGG